MNPDGRGFPRAADQPTAPLSSDLAFASVSGDTSCACDVTITNLTSGQPLSPAIAVTHAPRAEPRRADLVSGFRRT